MRDSGVLVVGLFSMIEPRCLVLATMRCKDRREGRRESRFLRKDCGVDAVNLDRGDSGERCGLNRRGVKIRTSRR